MPMKTILYEPSEDTFLLKKHIKGYAQGIVLEIGTGSGMLAVEAAESDGVQNVLAVDIQKAVVEHCKSTIKNPKIHFQQSDLFSAIPQTQKFDCIIFNPPYLPEDKRAPDITLDGGKKGWETIERFLNQANQHLKEYGKILLLFSSLTNKNKVDEIIKNNLFVAKEIDKQHISFETLYIYLIEKSPLLRELEKHDISGVHFFAKGKRGLVFKGKWKEKEVIIKVKNPQSAAQSTLEFEAQWLKRVNPLGIGPKLFFAGEHFLVMEFIDGISFMDFIEKNQKKKIQKIIQELCAQMYRLDILGINKQEMTHPHKHIIIQKKKEKNKNSKTDMPVLIDFERCRYTNDSKVLTQFLQFLTSAQVSEILRKKKIIINKEKIQTAAKAYKEEKTKENYKKIMGLIIV